MVSEIDQDVEEFRRRLDTVVRDAEVVSTKGVGILEEIVEFDPIPFSFDIGKPEIQLRSLTTGACCYTDETATTICADELTLSQCQALGGDFNPHIFCSEDPCLGACCEASIDGGFVCEDLTESDCADVDGIFKGIDSACDDTPDPCALGACCQSTGCTDDIIESDCNDLGGDFILNAHCSDDPSPCLGACCFTDEPCSDLTEPDCDFAAGGFQGVGTSCADDPDPCLPTGACCDPDTNVCTEETEDDCVDLILGTYKGDGTTCVPDPCLVCPSDIQLLCDSISAFAIKCGFAAFDGSTRLFLTRTATMNDSFSINNEICGGNCNGSGSSSLTETATINPLLDCAQTINRSGQTNSSTTSNGCDNEDCTSVAVPGSHVLGMLDSEFGENTSHNPSHCTSYCGGSAPFASPSTVSPTSQIGFASNNFGSASIDVELSNEFTNDQLIAMAEASLPPYFGHFGCEENVDIGFRGPNQNCVCFSSRTLTNDQQSYTIERFKFIFTFTASDSPIRITWFEVFVPASGGSALSVRHFEDVAAGATQTTAHEILEPNTNGTIHIQDISCGPVP